MHSTDVFRKRSGWVRRILRVPAIVLYCLALLLLFDVLYSNFWFRGGALARISDPEYHHALKPDFAGSTGWGWDRFPLITNSLRFRDGAVREVPLASDTAASC